MGELEDSARACLEVNDGRLVYQSVSYYFLEKEKEIRI